MSGSPDDKLREIRHEKDILAIQERERQCIGRVLHDDLGQRIAAASYMSHALAESLTADESPWASQAADLRALLDDAHALTRALARGFHPPSVTADGLIHALDDLAQQTASMPGVECEFQHVDGTAAPLTDEAADHLLHIAREAVCNALHHGKASRIRIELTARADYTVLSIRNDGCGLPEPASGCTGLGMRIMKFRADLIGGTLATHAADEGGTVVTCTLPRGHDPS